MFKKIVNKYFVMTALIVTGSIVFAWTYILTMHPFITIFVLLTTSGLLVLNKKIKRKKSS